MYVSKNKVKHTKTATLIKNVNASKNFDEVTNFINFFISILLKNHKIYLVYTIA